MDNVDSLVGVFNNGVALGLGGEATLHPAARYLFQVHPQQPGEPSTSITQNNGWHPGVCNQLL